MYNFRAALNFYASRGKLLAKNPCALAIIAFVRSEKFVYVCVWCFLY